MAQYTIVEEGGVSLPLYMTFGDGENDSEDGARIRDYLEALARDYCLQPTEDEKCAHALALLGMVSEIYLRRRTEDGTFGSKWYVNHARQYVVEHIAEQIRVPDLAGVSQPYVHGIGRHDARGVYQYGTRGAARNVGGTLRDAAAGGCRTGRDTGSKLREPPVQNDPRIHIVRRETAAYGDGGATAGA